MSNFKLINIKTKAETICSKVNIDGFDYYLSDDTAGNGDKLYLLRDSLLGKKGDIITVVATKGGRTDIIKANGDKHWFASDTEYQKEWNWKKVIATSNLDTDLPKVIDGVQEIATKFVISKVKKSSQAAGVLVGFIEGYKDAKETSPFNGDDMILFLDFYKKTGRLDFNSTGENHGKTSVELLELFKEKQIKVIYYE